MAAEARAVLDPDQTNVQGQGHALNPDHHQSKTLKTIKCCVITVVSISTVLE